MTEYLNGLAVIAAVFIMFKIMALFYFKTGQWDKYAYTELSGFTLALFLAIVFVSFFLG